MWPNKIQAFDGHQFESIKAAHLATSVLAVEIQKCNHSEKQRHIVSLPDSTTFLDIFERYHGQPSKTVEFNVRGKATTDCAGQEHDILPSLTVGEVVYLFNVRCFNFECTYIKDDIMSLASTVLQAKDSATHKAVDAFQLLMSGGSSLPTKKTSRYVSNKRKVFYSACVVCFC